MKKILQLLFLVLSCSFLLLCSCNKESKNEISIGYWINNSNERKNNQYIFDEFEKKYPGYTVKTVPIAYDSYGEEIPRMYKGGTLPDVLWVREEYMPLFINKGIIECLDDFVTNDEDIDLSKYFFNAIEFCKYNSKLYALPRDIGVKVMAFNLDIFEDKDLPSASWNWSDMVELGKKYTIIENGVIKQFGLGWTDWKSLVSMNEGKLFSEDGKAAYFNSDNVVKAIQFYSDLANVYHIMPTSEDSQGLGNPFTGKKAAFAVIGPWDFSRLKKLGINYDIRPLPLGDGKDNGKIALSGLQIALNSKSNKKNMAYELIKFLTYSTEAQTLQAQYSIAMPSIKEIAKSDAYLKSEYAPKSMNIYFDVLENKTIVENHFEGETIALAEFDDWLYKIFNNVDGKIQKANDIKDEMNESIQCVLNEIWGG